MQRNHTNAPRYYVRPVVTDHNAVQAVVTAYRAAGLEPPTTTPEAVAKVQAAPDVDAVALDLARQAHTAEDADQWYTDALATIARAQAAVQLRHTLADKWHVVAREHLATLRAQSAEELRDPFDRIVSQLSKDAAKLPTGKGMFDTDAILEVDASAPFKRTRENLKTLALIANVWPAGRPGNYPPEWVQLAPIIHVPEVTQERVEWVTGVPENKTEARVAYAVRELGQDARRLSLDHVLCNIAAGRHDGFRLQLADTDELAQRYARLHTAYTHKVNKPKLDPED